MDGLVSWMDGWMDTSMFVASAAREYPSHNISMKGAKCCRPPFPCKLWLMLPASTGQIAGMLNMPAIVDHYDSVGKIAGKSF